MTRLLTKRGEKGWLSCNKNDGGRRACRCVMMQVGKGRKRVRAKWKIILGTTLGWRR